MRVARTDSLVSIHCHGKHDWTGNARSYPTAKSGSVSGKDDPNDGWRVPFIAATPMLSASDVKPYRKRNRATASGKAVYQRNQDAATGLRNVLAGHERLNNSRTTLKMDKRSRNLDPRLAAVLSR